tara:strand:- start:919 stop:1191 length:273 start_codon:yes stop_codon:yes gene_type:complete
MLVNPDEINKSLSSYNWQYKNQKIVKTFNFKTYMDGVDFVNKVAEISERKNHHPEILLEWCKVTLEVASHDMGGVTTKCVNLAMEVESTI